MPNGGHNHFLGSLYPLLSSPSLILLCILCSLFASCGVWYLFVRLALNRKPTCATVHQNTDKDINPHMIGEEDEEQNIDMSLLPLDPTFIQPSGHKKRYYGNIMLSNSFKKPYGMHSWFEHNNAQNQNQARRRSSSKNHHLDVEERRMVDTQLAHPYRSLFSSTIAQVSTENRKARYFADGTNVNANVNPQPSRPNRMWGPRANVTSSTLPPRTISRTISFWKRTSLLAMKYKDDPYLHKARFRHVYVSQPDLDVTQHRERRRPLPHPPPLDLPLSLRYINEHIRNSVQSDSTSQKFTTETTFTESAVSNHTFQLGPFPKNWNTNQTQTRYNSVHSSVYTYSEASSSILRTPGSEVSHLGMDTLRAAVDDNAGLSCLDRPFDEVTMKMNSDQNIHLSAASDAVSHHRDNPGDPYLRVQNILEYAYRISPLPSRQEQRYLQSHSLH